MKTRRPVTQPGWKLTRPRGNRGHKFVVALVARPHVADASGRAKLRSLGNQQDVAATRAVGSTKIMGRGVLGVGAMAARRFSSTLPHAPRSGLIRLDVACHLWRPCDAFVKLSWPGCWNRFIPELANSRRQAFSFVGPRASPRPQNWGNQESVCKAWSVISPAMDHQSWLLLRVVFRLRLFLTADIG